MKRYKFLKLKKDKIVSKSGNNFIWEIGKWYKEDNINMCTKGFHCSVEPLDALAYVSGEILAIVEVRGKSEKEEDKECWEEMRITEAYKWAKKDSVALAIYSAELVIDNFEKEYPDDGRPRKAIEAAKRVLKNDTAKNRKAAKSAAQLAARSAQLAIELAKLAAWSAVWSAEAAARLAEAAARATAWSAVSAAQSTTPNKINKWMIKHIKVLEEK